LIQIVIATSATTRARDVQAGIEIATVIWMRHRAGPSSHADMRSTYAAG